MRGLHRLAIFASWRAHPLPGINSPSARLGRALCASPGERSIFIYACTGSGPAQPRIEEAGRSSLVALPGSLGTLKSCRTERPREPASELIRGLRLPALVALGRAPPSHCAGRAAAAFTASQLALLIHTALAWAAHYARCPASALYLCCRARGAGQLYLIMREQAAHPVAAIIFPTPRRQSMAGERVLRLNLLSEGASNRDNPRQSQRALKSAARLGLSRPMGSGEAVPIYREIISR